MTVLGTHEAALSLLTQRPTNEPVTTGATAGARKNKNNSEPMHEESERLVWESADVGLARSIVLSTHALIII